MFRRTATAVVLAAMLLTTAVPTVLADTCCANTSVTPVPRTVDPGDTVRLDGIACFRADNSGPLPLDLVEFWLSADRVPADPNPGDTPGNPDVHLAADLPPSGQWLPFASVTGEGQAAAGSATIVIPDLPDGRYQLWWRCGNDGTPESGIHYSGSPRLTVGSGTLDTSTAGTASGPRPTPPFALLMAAGIVAALATVRRAAAVTRTTRG